MAEGEDKSEKTEEPTDRKLRQAREEGDVPKSQEVSGWFTLAAGLAMLAFLAPGMSRSLAEMLQVFLAQPHELAVDPTGALTLVAATAMRLVLVVGLAFVMLLIAAIFGNIVQTGVMFTPKKIAPKIDKLDPIKGVTRMFGPEGWMNFFKGVGKMTIVGLAIAAVLWPRRNELAVLPGVAPVGILQEVYSAAIQLMIAALIAYTVIAVLDFLFQRKQYIDRNKMSRKEIRDEMKDTEGDPMIRAKLRQIRQERAQRRMMARVPDAAVVITNPTHYAVALEYEQGRTPAPICIAKGTDEVALRIRALAEEHDIPIVEDPPLARGLFASVELEEVIPAEHFTAVAKVIGYVLMLAGKGPKS